MQTQSIAPTPREQVMDLLLGKWRSQAVATAAELGLADRLAGGAETTGALAKALSCNEDNLYRLLRALASLGLFHEVAPRTFELTSTGSILREDCPGSVYWLARMTGMKATWLPWGHLVDAVKNGISPFEKVFGTKGFAYLEAHPEDAAIFNGAMMAYSLPRTAAILEAYDFGGIRNLYDVGGGYGHLLAGILHQFKAMNGAVVDLPHARAGAEAFLERELLSGRARYIEGSFFDDLPRDADAHILKNVLHDWGDSYALKILKKCHEALPPNGKILLVEMVVPSGDAPHFSKFHDLEMMVVTEGGRERDESEFRALLQATGFSLSRVVPTKSPLSIIEGHKIA